MITKCPFSKVLCTLLLFFLFSSSFAQQIYLSQNGALRSFTDDVEILDINSNKKNITSRVQVSDTDIVRIEYDLQYRTISRKTWSKNNNALIFETIFAYLDNSTTPVSKIETDYVKNKVTETTFSSTGNQIKRIEYNDLEKSSLFKTTTWEYNFADKIISMIVLSDEEENSQETFYEYKNNGEVSSIKEYDNLKLVKEKIFEKENYYVEILYFEDEIQIISTYEDENKINEVYIINGVESRRKEW